MTRIAQIALTLTAGTAMAAATAFSVPAMAAKSSPGVQVGKLTCAVQGEKKFVVGSKADLSCTYKPVKGPVEYYSGSVSDYGLDIGTTDSATMIWGVVAPSADMEPGALAGNYGGVTAGASIGAGLKANALIGGLDKSVALNPLSVESQTGVNLTAGVSSLSLKPAG